MTWAVAGLVAMRAGDRDDFEAVDVSFPASRETLGSLGAPGES